MKISITNNHYPILHYFEHDFLTMYEKTWATIENRWTNLKTKKPEYPAGFIDHEDMPTFSLTDAVCAQFYLLYSNNCFSATSLLDFFYSRQENNGAIRAEYNKETLQPKLNKDNPEGLACPLLLWAEHNYFNKTDDKKRLKEIIPILDKYLDWIISVTLDKTGLFHAPASATLMPASFRRESYYPIDFNSMMASAFYYMSKLANFTNHRILVIKYTKKFYELKSLINNCFWNEEDQIYYDLNEEQEHVKIKTILSFCPMIVNIPNSDKAAALVKYLQSPEHFLTENPFPSLSRSEQKFSSSGLIYKGSTHSLLNFIVIKGLEVYQKYEFLRECAIKHLYGILSVYEASHYDIKHAFWEAYQSHALLPAKPLKSKPVRPNYIAQTALSTITMMIENVIGIEINLPKKMLHWVIPELEDLGVEYIQLKKNFISTMLVKSNRGWEIRHCSEKLYYFSVDLIGLNKKKTLPFPSGKCSLLLDKI